MSFRVPEKFRVRTGPLASTAAIGNAGAFDIRLPHVSLFAVDEDVASIIMRACDAVSKAIGGKP